MRIGCIISIIIALLLSSASSVFTTIAAPDKFTMIMARQDKCLKSYSQLLQFFKKNSDSNIKYDNDYDVDFPDDYGGIYFDNQCGEVTLSLTDLDNQDIYAKYFDKALLNIKVVDYSFDELTEVYRYLSKHALELAISYASISEKNNCVNVSMMKDDTKDELLNLLDTNNMDRNIISFEENSCQLEFESPNIISDEPNLLEDETFYARAGERTYVTSSTNGNFKATIGANAYDPYTHKYGILTAGHLCEFVPNPLVFYNCNTEPINLASSAISQVSGNCDAGFIPFYAGYNFVSSTAIINGNNSSQIYNKTSIVSPAMCGSIVVSYGDTTKKQSGSIISLSTTFTADGITLEDVIQCNIAVQPGDSGGPMGIDTTNGLCLLGILTGHINTNSYFIKWGNIEQALEIEILSVQ